MLTVACAACGTRHRLLMALEVQAAAVASRAEPTDARGLPLPEGLADDLDALMDGAASGARDEQRTADERRDRERRLVLAARGVRACACGSDRFTAVALEAEPRAEQTDAVPVLLVGPEHRHWLPRHREIHFAGAADGRIAVVSTDLQWGVEEAEDAIGARLRDHGATLVHGDVALEEAVAFIHRPMAKRSHYAKAEPEAARLGLGAPGALAQAVRHALAELHRDAPCRPTPPEQDARPLERAGALAFLWIDLDRQGGRGWSDVRLVSGDFAFEHSYGVRHRSSNHLFDEDDALRAFRMLEEDVAEHGFEVFATDDVRDEIAAAAAVLGHTIAFPIGDEQRMIGQTASLAKQRLEAAGQPVPDRLEYGLHRWGLGGEGDPRAGVREWRISAGEAPAKPVIFLDIDGALLPLRTRVLADNPEAFARLLQKRPEDLALYPQVFDPAAVAMLNRLAALADAHFVISSNWLSGGWRRDDRPAKVRDILVKNGLAAARFHTDFAVHKSMRGGKEREICQWLDRHPMVHRWVTIEDDAWGDERCVPCSYEDGMTAEVYRRACQVLGVEDVIMAVRRPRRRDVPDSLLHRYFF